MLLRFRDLNERRIVANWPTLLRLIERQGFPAGIRLGPNMRAWPEAEIEAWLESRRIPSPAWRHLKHKPDPDLPQAPNPSGSRHADEEADALIARLRAEQVERHREWAAREEPQHEREAEAWAKYVAAEEQKQRQQQKKRQLSK